jgi:hypothetical protein
MRPLCRAVERQAAFACMNSPVVLTENVPVHVITQGKEVITQGKEDALSYSIQNMYAASRHRSLALLGDGAEYLQGHQRRARRECAN